MGTVCQGWLSGEGADETRTTGWMDRWMDGCPAGTEGRGIAQMLQTLHYTAGGAGRGAGGPDELHGPAAPPLAICYPLSAIVVTAAAHFSFRSSPSPSPPANHPEPGPDPSWARFPSRTKRSIIYIQFLPRAHPVPPRPPGNLT